MMNMLNVRDNPDTILTIEYLKSLECIAVKNFSSIYRIFKILNNETRSIQFHKKPKLNAGMISAL